MTRAIRSELTRLLNPAFILGGMGLMVFFGLLSTTVLFYTVGSGSAALPNTGGITLAALEASDGMFAGMRNFVGMLGVITLVVWAMGATTDYSSGLIRLLVQAEPSRWRLLVGKVVALTAFTCVSMLVTVMVVLPLAPAIADMTGVSTDAWSSGVPGTVVAGYLQLTLSVLLWGVVGLFVGMLTKSSGIAIGIGIGYLMLFEGLAGMLLESTAKWLPGEVFGAIASGGTADMGYATALVIGAGYAVAALAASVVMSRRDITA
jgi:ABC-type transport system involved in multi-copper enzyme maturation permease subunit